MAKVDKKTNKARSGRSTKQPNKIKRTKKALNVTSQKEDENHSTPLTEEQGMEIVSEKELTKNAQVLTTEAIIVGVLYSAGQTGRDISELRKVLELDNETIKQKIEELTRKLDEDPTSGLMLRAYGSKYKLLTKVGVKKALEKLFKIKRYNPLSQKVLEVLMIIAYKQPCTRNMINSIRGSDSSLSIERLLELGYIAELGRQDSAGRPFLYEVTQSFYDLLGISDLSQLPKIGDLDIHSYKESDLFANDYDEE